MTRQRCCRAEHALIKDCRTISTNSTGLISASGSFTIPTSGICWVCGLCVSLHGNAQVVWVVQRVSFRPGVWYMWIRNMTDFNLFGSAIGPYIYGLSLRHVRCRPHFGRGRRRCIGRRRFARSSSRGGSMNETIFVNNAIVEQTVDNGDGTGTRTTFHPTAPSTRWSNSPGCRSHRHRNLTRWSDLQDQLAAQQATIDALLDALGGSDG